MSLQRDEERPSRSHSPSEEQANSKAAATAKTILLVEDERMIREMIALDLQDEGMRTITAADGAEAIEILREHTPDLILLDILMPRKDGFAVLEYLQKKEAGIPVIMLSNLGSPDQEVACKKMGAKDFIVKSELDTGALWTRIKKYLA